MQPLTIFESHFRAAEVLLKVFRLLSGELDRAVAEALLPQLREALQCEAKEPLILLLNDLFMGLVRERAAIPQHFFGEANLALLLRQAVVSSCTALDVFVPSLLEAHLPPAVEVRQRNFLPPDNEVRNLFRDFRLKLEDLPALLDEESAGGRWRVLTRKVLDFCRDRTLSNVDGISAVLLILGVQQPWKQIALKAGMAEQGLRTQMTTLIKRRNDIVHRGDRLAGEPDGEPQPIDYPWTQSHVNALESVVLACDALAKNEVRQLQAAAGAA